MHRTLDAAITIFEKAASAIQLPARMAIGLGLAYYSRGNYDNAVKSLLHAAEPYPRRPARLSFSFSRQRQLAQSAEEVIARFRRFAEQQPKNGRAQYYYAMSLWKGKRARDSSIDLAQIGALLQKAIALDPSLAEAHLHWAISTPTNRNT